MSREVELGAGFKRWPTQMTLDLRAKLKLMIGGSRPNRPHRNWLGARSTPFCGIKLEQALAVAK